MMQGWGFVGGGRGGSGGLFGPMHHRFEEQYHCYSVAYADKAHVEKGDKILLPPSAFDTLARLQVDYPMLFRLSSPENKITHCGVLEFTAEEGTCYIPFWMMQNLLLEEGSVITVTNISLPKATFVKLQPQHTDFLEISNPRAVLEHALRNFSCVTKGDVIQIPYNNKNYHFELKDVQPQDAACIIETDCQVDFDAPVGYQEEATMAASKKMLDSRSASSSTCPSPTLSSTSSVLHGKLDADPMVVTDTTTSDDGVPKIRIVDGKIVRPEDDTSSNPKGPATSLLAPKTGATGVQRNAAIPDRAPTVDYWAIQAGDGARLDGKAPATLKDKEGNVVDVRKLRAEAAAQRLQQQQQQQQTNAAAHGATEAGPPVVSKRKPIVGSKYSRLKQSAAAFHGSAGTMK